MKKNTDKIKNGNYLTKYFTQFPNIIDDSELTPFEFRVLIHYYRVGECWEGVRATAKKCKMSTGKVTNVRHSLEQKGFINISPIGDGVTIDVIDRSQENLEKYSSCGEQSVHDMNDSVHHMNETSSPHEHKNNTIKNNTLRNMVADAPESKLISDKKKIFQETIRPYVKTYGGTMCNEFYSYWGEVNKHGKKLRWELEDTWEIHLRLARWKKNSEDKKFDKSQDAPTVVSNPDAYHKKARI